jgi:hypothetical protein
MRTVLLPPAGYPIAVEQIYHIISYHCWFDYLAVQKSLCTYKLGLIMKTFAKEATGCFAFVLYAVHLSTSYTYRVFFRSHVSLRNVPFVHYLPSAYSGWGPFH